MAIYNVTYDIKKEGRGYVITRNVDKTLPTFLWIPLSKMGLEKALLDEAKK